ncbi:MAG: GDP-mannose 4,6-dehydratase [Gemmatimonadaceae bacterium]
MSTRSALITGVTGQDGVYLARLLLRRGYRIIGVTRQASHDVSARFESLGLAAVEIRTIADSHSDALDQLLSDVKPDEIYHLAAQSDVTKSWNFAMETCDATAMDALRLLEAMRRSAPTARTLIASTAEIFGEPEESPQSEETAIRPHSPYGASKAFAYWMTAMYRRRHGLWCASAILYNHESPLRSLSFVTRKITDGVARIVDGQTSELRLGNLDARRDWGHASDYVDAMWRMLQCDAAIDVVIGSGVSRSVREFCEIAFAEAGLDYRDFVVQDEQFFRPVDSVSMLADARLAAERIGWRPSVSFEELVREMVRADLERVRGSAQ